MKFIKDLWRGDVPLASTYWTFGFVVAVCIRMVDFVARVVVAKAMPQPGAFVAVALAFAVVGIGHHFFMLGATWRSASKYTGRPIWRILAKTHVGLLAVLWVVGFIAGAMASFAKPNTVNDDTLRRTSEIVNRSLPRMIDQATRLDSTTVAHRELVYHYTIVTKKASEIEGEAFLHAMRSNMHRQLCGTKYVQSVMRNSVSVSYSFEGMDRRPIGKVALVAADCSLMDEKK